MTKSNDTGLGEGTRPAKASPSRAPLPWAHPRRTGGTPDFGIRLPAPSYAYAEVSPMIRALVLAAAERAAQRFTADYAI